MRNYKDFLRFSWVYSKKSKETQKTFESQDYLQHNFLSETLRQLDSLKCQWTLKKILHILTQTSSTIPYLQFFFNIVKKRNHLPMKLSRYWIQTWIQNVKVLGVPTSALATQFTQRCLEHWCTIVEHSWFLCLLSKEWETPSARALWCSGGCKAQIFGLRVGNSKIVCYCL